jgi:hypothetical protein
MVVAARVVVASCSAFRAVSTTSETVANGTGCIIPDVHVGISIPTFMAVPPTSWH